MTENEKIIEEANEIAKGRMYATNEVIRLQKELEQYRAIGTVEECRVAVERMKPKKPYLQDEDCLECPTCDSFIGYVEECKDEHYQDNYCSNCGQKLDWS